MIYSPDNWVIIKICDENKLIYKVLAGWYGGYLGSDSWRLNSGIVKIREDNGCFVFAGYSGSEYYCRPNNYGLRTITASVFYKLKDRYGVELMPEDTDWTKLLEKNKCLF